ncbi:MAG TPA: CotH kinase family protein [Verrucomicrobiae bacterium]|nr:CotH kinase family protein [Verrucomicrobiae bacterium]
MLDMVINVRFVGGVLLALGIIRSSVSAEALPSKAADIYRLTNVWSLHLKFDPAEWEAMEPKGGGGGFPPFGGGPRGPGGGPGGPGGPRMGGFGGPGGGPPPASMILAPVFMRDGDQDGDRKISQEEFAKLGDKWFTAWDKDKSGKLNNDQVIAGMNALIIPPGGPGGFGPPGMRGGGGRGGFNLQGPEGGRNGIAARMGVEFTYVRGVMQFENTTLSNVAVRYKGNGTFLGSRNSDKKSIKIDLNKFVKGQKLGEVTSLNLHNGVTDSSYMNEALAYKLYRDARVPSPRTAYARVNISNGGEHKNEYFGLYIMVENIDDEFTKEHFQTKGGALFKPVTPSLFEDLGDDWDKYTQTFDPKDKPSKEEIARVLETCKFVSKASDGDFAAKLSDYIDIDAFARYMAVTVYLSDLDGILGPGQNFYLYLHPKTKQFHFIAWDQDHSFGQMRGSQEDRERLSINRPWQGENRFLERVFKVEAFKKAYLARMKEFSESLFKPERFAKEVDELAPVLRPAIKKESDQKLERFEAAVAGKQSAGGEFRFMGEGAKPIKGFVVPRSESVSQQLAGKSEGNTLGNGGMGGPGNFLGGPFLRQLDANADKELTKAEFSDGFAKWFSKWDSKKSGSLDEDQLRAGIDQDVAPRPTFPR